MKRKLMILLLCLAVSALFVSVSAADGAETAIEINGMTTEQLITELGTNTACRFYLSADYTLVPPSGGFVDCPLFNILDLNGYTLDLGSSSLQINDNFYLEDSSPEKTGLLTGSGGGGSNYVVIVKKGTLTVRPGVNISGSANGISVNNIGALELYGNVSAPTGAIYNRAGSVQIFAGASVTTTNGSAADIAVYNGPGGTVTVNAGSVTTAGHAIYNESGKLFIHGGSVATTGTCAVFTRDGTMTVDGGSITAEGKEAIASYVSKVIVSGGTITSGAEPAIALTGDDTGTVTGCAELTMGGGTVTQTGDGAAVLLSEHSRADISGGTVSAPYTGGSDGGIGIILDKTDCKLTLSGGTVEAYCCGVFSNSTTGMITLSGAPAFSTGNAANADIEMVEWDNNFITIAAPLTYTGRTISVRLCGDENRPGIFTSGYSTHHPDRDPSTFFSTKGGTVVLEDGEASIANEPYGITLVCNEDEGMAYASIYEFEVEEAYAGSTVQLAAEPASGLRLAYWEAVEPADLIIEGDQFTMPACGAVIRAVFEPVYAVYTDGNAVVGIIWSDGSREEVLEAGEGDILDVWLSDDARSDAGYYFAGEFTVDGETLGFEPGYGFIDYFTMPADEVEVCAVQEAQTELTLSFDTNPVEVPGEAYDMIAGFEDSVVIDIDESGTDDILLYYDDETGECLAQLLPENDAPAGTYLYDTYDGAFDPYSSIRFTIPVMPRIAGYTLRLGGVLGLRCYVEIPEGYESDPAYADACMTFSMPNRKDQTFLLSNAADETVDGKACKRFECSVYAYQMADEIHAMFSYGDGFEVADSTTLEEYLIEVREGADYSDQAKALAAAAINYGHYIQPYLARVNGWEYGVKYAPLSDYGQVNVSAAATAAETYKYILTAMDGTAVASAQYKLTLNADTEMTIRIRLKSAPEGAVAVKVDGNAVTPAVSGTTYTVRISNIAANNLGVGKTVTMEIDGAEVFNMTVSPMSYVYTVLPASTEEDEQNAMAALYEYYRAAYEYAMQ